MVWVQCHTYDAHVVDSSFNQSIHGKFIAPHCLCHQPVTLVLTKWRWCSEVGKATAGCGRGFLCCQQHKLQLTSGPGPDFWYRDDHRPIDHLEVCCWLLLLLLLLLPMHTVIVLGYCADDMVLNVSEYFVLGSCEFSAWYWMIYNMKCCFRRMLLKRMMQRRQRMPLVKTVMKVPSS